MMRTRSFDDKTPSLSQVVPDVGSRQRGRIHGENVVDVPCERAAIASAVRAAAAPERRRACANMTNPYGDGHAASRIVEVLRTVSWERLRRKHFVDIRYS